MEILLLAIVLLPLLTALGIKLVDKFINEKYGAGPLSPVKKF